MILPEYVKTMAAYNAELNRRVYGAARRLPDEVRKADRGLFWKSIHGTLSHLYWADRMWLSRFGAAKAPDVPIAASSAMVEDFDDLWMQRQGLDAQIIAWGACITLAELEGELRWFSGAVGREMIKPKALCVMQIFNHQTHHRGQAHAALTALGESTGDTDLPFVLPG